MSILSKEELINSKNISSQQSLVDIILKDVVRDVKRPIPGGKTLFKTYPKDKKESLVKAIYTWLRGCQNFSRVMISFAKDPAKFTTGVTKIVTYDDRGSKPKWEQREGGKLDLANEIATIMHKHKCVAIEVKPDGIFIHEDKTNTFAPNIEITDELKKKYKKEYAANKVGEVLSNPEWEPFVLFTPSAKTKYSVLKLPIDF